ncbi:MAG: translation initiation factor IF-2, partial [Candidatus Aenigmarchaeota archaeon]|nr:translation initiation factor IF-2 [Candidatus Aenigmarchaeota archaeon]
MIRQPIVCILGHVDHGKTSLLDKIRGTGVVAKEAGAITQHVGASHVPIKNIKHICGPLLEKLKLDIDLPGLLFLDTPGHSAFVSIRERGGSIADIAVLVVDINEGFLNQTDESLEILKTFKTPFIVAATKVDKVQGWVRYKDECFHESFAKQPEHVKKLVDEKLYKLVGQLSERGFDSERYDRVDDFRKNITIVPCSGLTGEGVQEVLMMVTGLAQNFLKGKLEVTEGIGKGSVLEVKELKGMGTTLDVILYDGEIRKGDWIIVGGHETTVTKIKALLEPPAMKEMRLEKQFIQVDSVTAASGVKIAAPNLENVTSGSPIVAVRDESKIEEIKKELEETTKHIEIETEGEGVILKADTLGSLEALIHSLKKKDIPIKKAGVGPVVKRDISEADAIQDNLKRVIIAFHVPVDEATEQEAEKKKIKLLHSNVIYKILDDYEKYLEAENKRIREEKLSKVKRPAILKLLPGMTFRASDPAIVGVEVEEGMIKQGYVLKKNGKEIGTIKAIQSDGTSVTEAKKGERVAVSITGPTVGRQIREGDELTTIVRKDDIKILEELGMLDEA